MALLKAFVCQGVLFGLYKLFLEQVVVDHLVPEELTRNCLVGLVFLLCFGIQLYTEKAEDDLADAEEDPKSKGKSTDVKKFDYPEVPVEKEIAVGSKAEERFTENKHFSTSRKVSESKNSSSISLDNSVEIDKTSRLGTFAEISTNVPDKINVAASTAVKCSIEQEPNTFPVLNGISDLDVSEESDEECIQIDQFESKISKKPEQLMTVEPKQGKDSKPELMKEPDQLMTFGANEVEAGKPKQPEEPEQLITVEDKEVEAFDSELVEGHEKLMTVEVKELEKLNLEQEKEAVTEYECLKFNDVKNSSTQDLDSNQMSESEKLISNESEEVQPIEPEPKHATETVGESGNLISNGVINSSTQDLNSNPMTGEPERLIKIELNTIKLEQLTDVEQSKNLISNVVNTSSEKELSLNPMIDELESKISNSPVVNSTNIADTPLNIRNENEINSIKDAKEIGDDGGKTSRDASQLDEHTKNLSKSSQFVQEIDCKNNTTKVEKNVQTIDKNSVEKSTEVNTKSASPRRKISASEGVYVTYFPIDISFIYACHKH